MGYADVHENCLHAVVTKKKIWLKVFGPGGADMVQFFSSANKNRSWKFWCLNSEEETGGTPGCLSPSWEVFPIACLWPCEWPLWAVGGVVSTPEETKPANQKEKKKNNLISHHLELSDRKQYLRNKGLASLPNILLAMICIILLELACKLYLIKHLGSVDPCGMYSRVKLSVWPLLFSMPEQRVVYPVKSMRNNT